MTLEHDASRKHDTAKTGEEPLLTRLFADLAEGRAPYDASYGPAERQRDFARAFAGETGYRVLYRIMAEAGLMRAAEPLSHPSASLAMAMREGSRNLGLFILAGLLRGDPAPRPPAARTGQRPQA